MSPSYGKLRCLSDSSGVTAPLLILALVASGHGMGIVYDGSWTEWGGRDDLPIVAGPPD